MLELNLENLDLSFDDKFLENDKLTWLPWVGVNFQSVVPRTLVLGESTYNWNPSSETVQERINKNDHLRLVHQNNAIKFKGNSKYTRNFERAVFNTKKPTSLKAKELWHSVAYHNLVLRCMKNLNARPKYDDYVAGWHEAFKIFELLNIDRCVCYGLEDKKIQSFKEVANLCGHKFDVQVFPKIGKNTPRIITLYINGKPIKVAFIRHPSSFFSWRKWAVFMQQHTPVTTLTSASSATSTQPTTE